MNLEEVLTKDAYVRLDEIDAILRGCDDVIAKYQLPASMKTLSAKGSIDWSATPIHEYRDLWAIDDRIPQLAWLWQLNRGVFKSPGSKWESWTTSIVMTRRGRPALRRQLRGDGRGDQPLMARVGAAG